MAAENKAASKKAKTKNSLVYNINTQRKVGTSNAKKDSTVYKEAYVDMENNWGKGKKK